MWHQLKYYAGRARQLSRKGRLAHAIGGRLRSWRRRSQFNALGEAGDVSCKEYSAALPAGYPARRITVRLSLPNRPPRPPIAFSEHVMDEQGHMTNTLLALTTGGFAISHDLGLTWSIVKVEGHEKHRFVQIKSIGESEYLIQGLQPEIGASTTLPLDLFVVSETGKVLVKHAAHGFRWHGCRAMDTVGGTLMFAEYISNVPVDGRRPLPSRVWRSRDRGRSWAIVFEQSSDQIRHFHFLQSRPGHPKEWWLTSGDLAPECHIWVTKDDGDTWADVSQEGATLVRISGEHYDRGAFRLTDLIWLGDDVVWATDDFMRTASPPGARVFRSHADGMLKPKLVGHGKWHFRSIVDIGDYLLLIAQRSNRAHAAGEDLKPGVYLAPKKTIPDVPALVHLFNLDCYPDQDGPGFTFSKASRAAVNGTFFSYRSVEDVFPSGDRILEWNVYLE